MAKQQRPVSIQTALIGLVGTLLTVGGGLCGAFVTSAVTIYQVEREKQLLAVSSEGGEQTLSIDTNTIFLSRQAAADLDPERYYLDFEHAIIFRRPLPGWDPMEEMTLEQQLAETNIPCNVACDQPVFRIRYGEPIEIESDRATTINGHFIPEDVLNLSEQLQGPPPWKSTYFSQVILNIYEKELARQIGVVNLADLILLTTQSTSERMNRMVAQEDSHFAILQGSSALEGIRMAGEPAALTLDDWLLFAESEKAYYVIEIAFTAQSGQPLQVWDDLQTYIDEFRIIE
jgi:hypothetical protein